MSVANCPRCGTARTDAFRSCANCGDGFTQEPAHPPTLPSPGPTHAVAAWAPAVPQPGKPQSRARWWVRTVLIVTAALFAFGFLSRYVGTGSAGGGGAGGGVAATPYVSTAP